MGSDIKLPPSTTSYTLKIDSGDRIYRNLWAQYAKNCLDNFQPFNELIDNAIAAIINKKGATGSIYITFDFEAQRGSIEHSGGTTFPDDDEALASCLLPGELHQTSLNEHGCGLKASLATLNPTNDAWKIWIKDAGADGALKVKSIQAPWQLNVCVNQETAWPGQNGNAEPGTFIEFPVSRDRFVDLYSTKSKAKMADLDQRIAAHFSHVWMKQDQVTGGLVRLHYNGVAITPFSFTAPDVFEFVDSHVKSDFTLSSGGHITLEEIKLKPTARRLPGSYKFRFALDANGLVFFKNGRWIESIHTDEPGRQLYSRILGGKPHNGHNGHIKLVNMTGTQAQLPATVPTKNRFSISPLFEELVTQLYDKIRVKLYVAGPDPEACMVTEYRKRMEKAVASLGLAVRYEQERVFQLPTGANCPPVDLTMETGDRIELMEFKRATRPQTDHFAQLFLNWKLASEASAKPVRPVLVLMKGDNNEVSAAHQQYVHVLATSGFRPEVRTTEGDMIWRLD